MASRVRLDQEMLRRGLVDSRSAGVTAIESGVVLVNGSIADKASRLVASGDSITLVVAPKYVGRGGEKIEAALDAFGLDVSGVDALDVGSSTGGFTDCLLQRGVRSVVALDVGHNQLHEKLRSDSRVRSFEGLHVKNATPEIIGGPFRLVVVDLSFISLKAVSSVIRRNCADDADLILLVKPQFEAGRSEVNKGQGVIRDQSVRQRVLEEVAEHYVAEGFTIEGVIDSPLPGASGNVEFLLYLRIADVEGNKS